MLYNNLAIPERQEVSELDMEKLPQEIREHLTGDSVHDLEYLSQKVIETADNRDLLEDLFTLITDHLSQSQMLPLFEKYIEKSLEQIRSAYTNASHLRDIGLFEEALEEIDGIVREIMPLNELAQSSEYDIQSFNEPFEYDLYEMLEPSKKVRNTPLPCACLLSLHGSLLLSLERVEEAITSLALALTWNPVSHDASILLAEAYKMKNDMDMLYTLTIDRFRTAFSKVHMAELYYNLGYYYGTLNRPEDSVACFTLCNRYGGQEIATSALYQLGKKFRKTFQWANDAQIRTSAETCGYPLVPDDRIIRLARMNATDSYWDGDNDHAIYYIRIALDLSGSPEDRSFLDRLTEDTVVM